MTTPIVSILIPNFNNGPSSANDGQRDFLGDLLHSLHETLINDPTPVEIIIADDGSTDESLATARQWAAKNWQQASSEAQPFCRLIELPHCGVLSKVANRLTNEAQGEIIVRLDGDIVVHTKQWASELKRIFDEGPPKLGVVGPLQLAPDGFVHAAGDWLLHPRGYHHIGQGISANAITRSMEVDHVMGCFYCFTRAVWETVGTYDETIMRGQTVDYGMRVRLAGFSTWAVPTITFTHYHSLRRRRSNIADRDHGLLDAQQRFQQKWGFDRVTPDLDVVAERYKGTPLLWNARVFGPSVPMISSSPITLETSRWKLYSENQSFQNIINANITLAMQSIEAEPTISGPVLIINCGDGLLCHLLAQRGLDIIGVDKDTSQLALARQVTGEVTYPGTSPQFQHQDNAQQLPIKSQSVGWVLLQNVIESHPNPVGLLRQVHEVLKHNGAALIVTPKRPTQLDNDIDRIHLYRAHELDAQLGSGQLFEVTLPTPAETPIGMVRIIRKSVAMNKPVDAAREMSETRHRAPVAAG